MGAQRFLVSARTVGRGRLDHTGGTDSLLASGVLSSDVGRPLAGQGERTMGEPVPLNSPL